MICVWKLGVCVILTDQKLGEPELKTEIRDWKGQECIATRQSIIAQLCPVLSFLSAFAHIGNPNSPCKFISDAISFRGLVLSSLCFLCASMIIFRTFCLTSSQTGTQTY